MRACLRFSLCDPAELRRPAWSVLLDDQLHLDIRALASMFLGSLVLCKWDIKCLPMT